MGMMDKSEDIAKRGALSWELTEEGCLIIRGEGRMRDFSDARPAPWGHSREKIRTVHVEDGVQNVGGRAFAGCNALEQVILGADVRRVGWKSFCGCTMLSQVNASKPLVHWRERADEAILVGHRAFDGTPWNRGQEQMRIRNGVVLEYVGDGGEIVMPEGVREIAPMAFEGKPLTSVTLPATLERIGTCAFAHTGLSGVELPQGVHFVEAYAFCGNPSLEYALVGKTRQHLHPLAFAGTPIWDMDASACGAWLIASAANNRKERFFRLDGRSITKHQLRRLILRGAVALELSKDETGNGFHVNSIWDDQDGVFHWYELYPCISENGCLGEQAVRSDDTNAYRHKLAEGKAWVSIRGEERDWLDKDEALSDLDYMIRRVKRQKSMLYLSWDRGNRYGPLELDLAELWLREHEEALQAILS